MRVRVKSSKPPALAPTPKGIHTRMPLPILALEIQALTDEELSTVWSAASELSRAYFLERQRRINRQNGSPLNEMDRKTRDYCLEYVTDLLSKRGAV
jgi:hypothetical protein